MGAPFPFRQPMRGKMVGGVASGPTKGEHEPMKLFKANPAAQSEADRARDLRLTSIASRYRQRPNDAPEPQPDSH
jgi:hypothetical protein